MPERFHRRSIRLKGYDYAQAGAYFVTICTHERAHLFGQVVEDMMMPNALGDIVQWCWHAIPEHMPHADIDEFVVMPNHVHGIVVIGERAMDAGRPGAVVGGVGARHDAPLRNAPPTDPRTKPPGIPHGALGQIVASFKTAVSRGAYGGGLLPRGTPIWQRNYYEHIIRDTADHDRIAQYIAENPANWGSDDLNR
jgi:REP-associated tyrosine transposase